MAYFEMWTNLVHIFRSGGERVPKQSSVGSLRYCIFKLDVLVSLEQEKNNYSLSFFFPFTQFNAQRVQVPISDLNNEWKTVS